jgi:hypothetical protein
MNTSTFLVIGSVAARVPSCAEDSTLHELGIRLFHFLQYVRIARPDLLRA